jgi:hypothetical protein
MHKARGDYDGGHSRRPHGTSGHHGQERHHCRPHEDHHHGLLEILLEHGGQEFCSQFLHLPATATATTTQTVSDVEATVTLTTTATSDPGTTTGLYELLSETICSYICAVLETTTSTSVTQVPFAVVAGISSPSKLQDKHHVDFNYCQRQEKRPHLASVP